MAVVLQSKDTTFEVKDSDLGLADGGDPNTVYTLRQLTRADYKRVMAANTKQVMNRATRGFASEIDHLAAEEDLLDYALVGWSGVVMADGTPAECSRDNKLNGLPSTVLSALLERAGLRTIQAGEADRQASFR